MKSELRDLLKISTPIIIAQLALTSMGFTDTVMAGHFNPTALAAVAIGSSIWLPIYLTVGGILSALTPITANLSQQKSDSRIRSYFHQNLWLALLLGAISWWLIRHCADVLTLLKVEQSLHQETLSFLNAISWSLPAATLYHLCRALKEGLAKTHVPMIVSVIGATINIPANYALMYGKWGAPELGATGCAWASTIVIICMTIAIILWSIISPNTRHLKLFNAPWLVDQKKMMHLIHIGLPIGFTVFIEVTIFTVIAILVAPLGINTVAAQQIALNLSGLFFMLPLSVAMGMTIHIGQALGQSNLALAKLRTHVGLWLIIVIAIINMSVLLLWREPLITLYTGHPQIIAMTTGLLLFAAIFQISDGIQVAAVGALRGYQDTKVAMISMLCTFWGVALPLGYTLTYNYNLGPSGFWIGLLTGLTLNAIILGWRLKKITSATCQH